MNLNSIEISKAGIDDIEPLSRLLRNENLPPDDIEKWIDYFLVLKDKDITIGGVGLEVWGEIGLFRSFVIAEEFRNKGYGKELYDAIMLKAKKMNLHSIVLLAKGAIVFFENNGFSFISREELPPEVKNSVQFNLKECEIYNVMIKQL